MNKIPRAEEFTIAKLTYKFSTENEKNELTSNAESRGKKETRAALEIIRQK
jgi:hypothetical protein